MSLENIYIQNTKKCLFSGALNDSCMHFERILQNKIIDLLIQIIPPSSAGVHQTSTWGATARVVTVAMKVNREKRIRQMRSRTIAANFQSA